MSTHRKNSGIDGGGRNTDNLATAMRRTAEANRCPSCQRKSALIRNSDHMGFSILFHSQCRWCGWTNTTETLLAGNA